MRPGVGVAVLYGVRAGCKFSGGLCRSRRRASLPRISFRLWWQQQSGVPNGVVPQYAFTVTIWLSSRF